METEIEAKFPDVDPKALRQKLKTIGAVREHPEVLMKRRTFDFPDRNLHKTGGWVRVRDEGDKITLSYKQLNDRSLHGTKEATVVVDDFDRTCAFLVNIGLVAKSFQETKREKWKYGGVEITIDTWPWVPTFAELEGTTEQSVRNVARELGFEWGRALHGSVEPIYQMHYDVTDTEIDHWESITFTPVPEWLEKKRRTA